MLYDTKLFKELPLKVSRDTVEHLLQIKADGYKTQELKIIPNQDIITIEASLTKVNEEAVNRRTDNVKHKRRDNVQELRNDNGLNIRKIKLNESKGIKIKRIQIGND